MLVEGQPETKPGKQLKPDVLLALRGETLPYASRGGLKLAHALGHFGIPVSGRVCLDAGASTGGFSDCLLQHGAAHVHAVDVGYGQLRGFLAADSRVSVYEKTNISVIPPALVPEPDFCSVDLSYLSLARALPILGERVGALETVALIKPLYEGLAEADYASHEPIVRVVAGLLNQLAAGLPLRGVCWSPIPGGRGAVECLLHVGCGADAGRPVEALLSELEGGWPAAG